MVAGFVDVQPVAVGWRLHRCAGSYRLAAFIRPAEIVHTAPAMSISSGCGFASMGCDSRPVSDGGGSLTGCYPVSAASLARRSHTHRSRRWPVALGASFRSSARTGTETPVAMGYRAGHAYFCGSRRTSTGLRVSLDSLRRSPPAASPRPPCWTCPRECLHARPAPRRGGPCAFQTYSTTSAPVDAVNLRLGAVDEHDPALDALRVVPVFEA